MVYNCFGQEADPMALHGQAQTGEGTHNRKADLHDLALLYIILACGAHADFNLPFHNEDIKRYRQLARAALALKSVFDTATLSAVQAIALLAQLDVLLGRDNALESSWRLMCLALSLAMSVSLVLLRILSFRLINLFFHQRSVFVSLRTSDTSDTYLHPLPQTVILRDGVWTPQWSTADAKHFGLFYLANTNKTQRLTKSQVCVPDCLVEGM